MASPEKLRGNGAESPKPAVPEDSRSILERYKDDRTKFSLFQPGAEQTETPTATPDTEVAVKQTGSGRMLTPEELAAIETGIQVMKVGESETSSVRSAAEQPIISKPPTQEAVAAPERTDDPSAIEDALRTEIEGHRQALASIEQSEQSPNPNVLKMPIEGIDARVAAHEQGIRDAERKLAQRAQTRVHALEEDALLKRIAEHRRKIEAIERGEKSPNLNVLKEPTKNPDAAVAAEEEGIRESEDKLRKLKNPKETAPAAESPEQTPSVEGEPQVARAQAVAAEMTSALKERTPHGAFERVTNVIESYNKLPKALRLAISGTLFTAGIGLAVYGGAIGATVASGVMIASRVTSFLGSYGLVNTIFGKKLEEKYSARTRKGVAFGAAALAALVIPELFRLGTQEALEAYAASASAAPEMPLPGIKPEVPVQEVAEHVLPPEAERVIVPEATLAAEDAAHIAELSTIELNSDIKEIFGHNGLFGISPSDGMEKFMYSVARLDAAEFMQGSGGATGALPNADFLQTTGITQHQAETLGKLIAQSGVSLDGKSVHQVMEELAGERVRESMATAGR